MGCFLSSLGCCCISGESSLLLLDDSKSREALPTGESQVDVGLDLGELKDMHFLANGGMCSIYTASFRNQRVVVKIPRDNCAQPEVACKDLETEVDILTRIHHPNIIKVVGAGYVSPLDVDGDGKEAADFKDLDQPPKRFVLLEHLAGGTLTEQMGLGQPQAEGMVGSVVSRRWHQNWQFPTKKALDSAVQLASALNFLHNGAVEGGFVVHRDLKPENIAFTLDGRLKLFDFGLAKVVHRRAGRLSQRYEMTGETGSTRYMCPEVALQYPYNEKADVYSFGLILWEMLTLKRPFEGLSRKEFLHTVIKGGKRPALEKEWTDDLKSLLRRCWSEDIDLRPDFGVIESTLRDIARQETTWGILSPTPVSTHKPAGGGGSVNGMMEQSAGGGKPAGIGGEHGVGREGLSVVSGGRDGGGG
ncbi:unnamed protein product, partial [Choristocarpus tenellus]